MHPFVEQERRCRKKCTPLLRLEPAQAGTGSVLPFWVGFGVVRYRGRVFVVTMERGLGQRPSGADNSAVNGKNKESNNQDMAPRVGQSQSSHIRHVSS